MSSELALGSDETKLALEMVDSGLPPLTRRDWIPFLFGISPKFVGAMEVRSARYYREFKIPKARGGSRQIVTPRRFLKTIQRWLLHRVFSHLPRSDASHGFTAGRSIFTNAQPHLTARNLLALDIRDFFPSVSYQRVKDLLVEHLPYPDAVISQIAGLCTLDGALPQGAPTSPVLANTTFTVADAKLSELAEAWGAAYTRYADDLAFSGERQFSTGDLEEIREIIAEAGFAIRDDKSRIVGAGGRQIVAGLVVNAKGYPPRRRRRRWRAMFHRASRFPHEYAGRVDEMAGIASFIRQYDPATAADYAQVVDHVRAQLTGT